MVKTANTATYTESFFNFEDAVTWLEGHMMDHMPDAWALDKCEISYINHLFRAGITFAAVQRSFRYE